MRRDPNIGRGSYRSSDDSAPGCPRGTSPAVSTRHILVSRSWTAQVEALEAAINGFAPDGHSTNECEVVFFEIAGDDRLHVNVTHRYERKVVSGWAGPGIIPDGFVHSRTFGDIPRSEMMRHIRDIVFAERA